jgi:hypothetical protein
VISLNLVLAGLRLSLKNCQVGEKWVSDDCSYLYKGLLFMQFALGNFLNSALALLGQGLKKSPIGQKLDFANHPYLCKGLV